MGEGSDFLKTADEFNKEVKAWTKKVRGISVNILASRTISGSGKLQKELEARIRKDKEKEYVNAVGFRFERYGAYREYGAGRGYVIKNGVIMRGRSAWADKGIRTIYEKKGFKEYQIRANKTVEHYAIINRSPLPWLDPPIQNNIEELADIAGEYHGDAALRDVLKQFNKITIKKNYGKK